MKDNGFFFSSFACHDMHNASDPMDVQSSKRINHRNFVNRFVTPFTAQPHQLCESQFLIGSSAQLRAVRVRRLFSAIAILPHVDHCTR